MQSKRLIYTVIYLSLILASCRNNQEFVFVNKTTSEIKDIKVSTSTEKSQSQEFIIQPMDSFRIVLNMKTEPNVDGSFYINFDDKRKDFGYFTNGSGIIDLYKITFLDDDISITEVNHN
jgi:hypothetical protein